MLQLSHDILVSQLSPSERLLWSDQPRSGLRLRVQDIFLIPFSILWCGFAIFWVFTAIRNDAPLFFILWGVPFLCFGMFFVFGRFIFDAWTRSRTFYGLTNERIIIVNNLFSQQVKSLQLRTLNEITLTQRADGSGSITFGPTNPMTHFFPVGAWPGMGRYAPPSFELIERVKEAYDNICEAQRSSSV